MTTLLNTHAQGNLVTELAVTHASILVLSSDDNCDGSIPSDTLQLLLNDLLSRVSGMIDIVDDLSMPIDQDSDTEPCNAIEDGLLKRFRLLDSNQQSCINDILFNLNTSA